MKPGRKPATPSAQDFGPKPELLWLPVHRLSIDMRYQRSLESRRSQALVDRIAAEFRWARFGAVLVSPLAMEAYAVLDGQHRLAGARRNGITEVPCIVIAAPSLADQAELFVAANRDRVAVHSFALHHALVAAGDAQHLTIAEVCRAADVEIVRYPIPATKLQPNQTLAIGTLKKVIKLRGDAITVKALAILRTAYPGLPGALRAHLIEGIATVLATRPATSAENVIDILKHDGLRGIEHAIQRRIEETGDAKAAALVAVLEGAGRTRPINAAPLKVVTKPVAPTPAAAKVPADRGPVRMPDLKPKRDPIQGARDVTAALMGDPAPGRPKA